MKKVELYAQLAETEDDFLLSTLHRALFSFIALRTALDPVSRDFRHRHWQKGHALNFRSNLVPDWNDVANVPWMLGRAELSFRFGFRWMMRQAQASKRGGLYDIAFEDAFWLLPCSEEEAVCPCFSCMLLAQVKSICFLNLVHWNG